MEKKLLHLKAISRTAYCLSGFLFFGLLGLQTKAQQETKNNPSRQDSKTQIQGKVVGVTDGDTLTLLVSKNTPLKIRLESIDAPEKAQEYGNSSKKELSKLVFGKEVSVEVSGKDRYQRYLGTVYIDKTNVNLEMVARGMAWHYKKYSSDPTFAAAEVSAMKAKIGLWKDYKPMAPWEYRALKRKGSITSSKTKNPGTSKPVAGASFWMNSGSNKRHNRSCRYFGNTKRGKYCTKSEGNACGICGG